MAVTGPTAGVRVVHVASEVAPFAKTGGLADVLGSLPAAVAALGPEVAVVTPAHRASLDEPLPGDVVFEVEALGRRAAVHEQDHHGVRVLLIDCPPLYVRPTLYGTAAGDYPDNAERFAFLSRAAIEIASRLGGADVIHAHDWQAALVPVLLARGLVAAPHRPRTVLTIHNLAYQGVFPASALAACELPSALDTTEAMEFYGRVSFLKGGIVDADAVTTVSPTYAREILSPACGCGLDGVLASRSSPVVGILNGLDVESWNPRTDRHLPRRYTAASVTAGKRATRARLVAELGLDGDRPLAAMVSRLTEQKGADLVAAGAGALVSGGWNLVVLGTGDAAIEALLRRAAERHSGRAAFVNRFDEAAAHLIYAAADAFLMPSRFEPCGLSQMIAMRYGAIPVVTPTGGLADTVTDIATGEGGGIVMDGPSCGALESAASRVAALLDRPRELLAVRRRNMGRDLSWSAPARRYLELYRSLLEHG